MLILVINAGSSSLKYQLFDMENESVLAKGNCERIGIEGSRIIHKTSGKDEFVKETELKDHSAATQLVVETLLDAKVGCISSPDEIEAIGHRVVHGGHFFTESVIANDEVMEALNQCIPYAPLHTPAHIMGIKGCMSVMPKTPQVLVFDTAFHQTMPKEAYMYGISYDMYEDYKIRRYGFHGTSHRYVSQRAGELMGNPELNVVTCHLGNGASVSAVKDGKCFDTSMGTTPLEGIMMGTRCGNIDAAIIPYLMKKGELTTADDIDRMMNKKSGMLGISQVTSDNQEICKRADAGDERCILIQNMYCHQLTKLVGGYIAAMGGTDAIVFTGGIGENTPKYRSFVCEKLAFLGVKIDEAKNAIRGEEMEISTPESTVKVFVIPTNEELVIARDTLDIVSKL